MKHKICPVFRLTDPVDAIHLANLRWRLTTNDSTDFDVIERDAFIARFEKELSSPSNIFTHWVAELDGRVVAVMSVGTVPKLPSPGKSPESWGYLTNCYTLPDYRHQGIGRRLLEAVRTWATEQPLEFVLVWPSDPSRTFYERGGFHRYSDPMELRIIDG